MKIIQAQYGIPGKYIDVTEILRSRMHSNGLHVAVNNSIAGDPALGSLKHLAIQIEVLGQSKHYTFNENTVCALPETSTDRLGIFYSNNHDSAIYPAITASLQSIQRAAQGKANIITCMWRAHPGNPFTELIAWTNSSSHLNQVLQILQCLYTAGEVQDYRYVSFLEHDVLYSEYYFDYPNFDSGILANMNYIGLNQHGWQARNQHDKPLSQLTMLYQDAVDHFSSLLKNALIYNKGVLEPPIPNTVWHCLAPSVHINHGKHFTSHYTIYSTSTTPHEPYWGDSTQYQHLFKS